MILCMPLGVNHRMWRSIFVAQEIVKKGYVGMWGMTEVYEFGEKMGS